MKGPDKHKNKKMDAAYACAACSSGWFNFIAGAAVALGINAGAITWCVSCLQHVLPPQVHFPLVLGISFARLIVGLAIIKTRSGLKQVAALLTSISEEKPSFSAADIPVCTMRRPVPREMADVPPLTSFSSQAFTSASRVEEEKDDKAGEDKSDKSN